MFSGLSTSIPANTWIEEMRPNNKWNSDQIERKYKEELSCQYCDGKIIKYPPPSEIDTS